jgi:FdhE protein
MPRTTPTIGAAGGFPAAAADPSIDPAWRPWLELLEIVEEESDHPAWAAAIVAPPATQPEGAPLLHTATVRLDTARAAGIVRHLAGAVGILGAVEIDPYEAIRAAIERDDATILRIAETIGASQEVLTVVAQLASVPLLHAAARVLDAERPPAWQLGYCPVCGAWPALVEMRGIERERRSRCTCCGASWTLPVLRCAFCGETDHNRLGYLLPEGEEQQRRIETCESCRGYLKVVTTLGALPFAVLALQDLVTVPLDLAAQDRGYARPSNPGWVPRIHFVT